MDIARFSDHYSALFPKIYSYMIYRVHDQQLSEDLTSQTFLKAMEKLEQFDAEKASIKTWLYTIAQNVLIDHFRTHRHHADLDTAQEISAEDDILASVIKKEDNEKVHQLLSKLTAQQRRIVILRLWDDLSYQEIAQLTGKSVASLKMTFMRALSLLRAESITLLTLLLFFIFD